MPTFLSLASRAALFATAFLGLPLMMADTISTTFSITGADSSSASATLTGVLNFLGVSICPCTLTHNVQNGTGVAQSFDWTQLGWAGTVNANATATISQTTSLNVGEAKGTLKFPGAGFMTPANYGETFDGTAALLKNFETVIKLLKSPEHIAFSSSVAPDGSEYLYTDMVTNLDPGAVPFVWTTAGMAGTLAGCTATSVNSFGDEVCTSPGGTMEVSFVSLDPGLEHVGSASFTLDDGSGTWVLPADVITPVPEPGALVLFGMGVVMVAGSFKMVRP